MLIGDELGNQFNEESHFGWKCERELHEIICAHCAVASATKISLKNALHGDLDKKQFSCTNIKRTDYERYVLVTRCIVRTQNVYVSISIFDFFVVIFLFKDSFTIFTLSIVV